MCCWLHGEAPDACYKGDVEPPAPTAAAAARGSWEASPERTPVGLPPCSLAASAHLHTWAAQPPAPEPLALPQALCCWPPPLQVPDALLAESWDLTLRPYGRAREERRLRRLVVADLDARSTACGPWQQGLMRTPRVP
eukprot:8540685-Alexandrium_andersonii.AAC.1